MSDAAETAAIQLDAVLPKVKSGSLRMFGDWFGRPNDNVHHAVAVGWQGDDLVVRFDDEEELTITEPHGWKFSEVEFRIQSARRVLWRWHAYGRPKTLENLFTIDHWVDVNGVVQARSDVDWYTPRFEPDMKAQAVELL